ncbi:MAG: hypothetical protein FJ011_04620 [Chloroflexi bacterium]|nr:hypothetical protein [Chloroflexota bacterium]
MPIARRIFWLLVGLCAALSALILLVMPDEKTIGPVIKLVYLHGALSRAGMLGLIAAGIAGAIYLAWPRRAALAWSQGLAISGWCFWVGHFIVSLPATRLTWGPWIAWGEPRVTMTLQIAAAWLIVYLVSRFLDHARFTASAHALFGVAVAALAAAAGVLRHPLDPIGASPSVTLRVIYVGLLIPVLAAMSLIAWRLAAAVRPPTAT